MIARRPAPTFFHVFVNFVNLEPQVLLSGSGGFTMRRLNSLLCSSALLLGASSFLLAQGPGDLRGIVDRTQADLHRAADFELHAHKQIDRYQNAETKLSDFDRNYTRGHLDRGKLNSSIDAVKNVVDHNTLSPDLRDALETDLRDLRMVRADHEKM